jgi:phage baseplate assembly protein V
MNIVDVVTKIVAPLRRRIFMMMARGVLQSRKDGDLQQLQITALADEVLSGIEYVEPYGFTSAPEAGAEVVALFMGGNRDHGVILSAGDRRYRLKGLASGDVALYHKDGTKIVLKGSGKIQIHNPAGNELFTVLSQLLQFLIDARTDTVIGPMPLYDITATSTLTAIKTKIDSFKV